MTSIGRVTIADVLAEHSRPLHIHEIASRLGLTEGAYEPLRRVLDDLCWDGSVVALPGQRFRLARAREERRAKEYEGTLNVNPRGFGFVTVLDLPDDVYVPPEAMAGALHGDTVAIRVVTTSRRGIEGEVVRVVKRKTTRVAGVLRKRGRSVWIEPDDSRLRGPIVLKSEPRTRLEDGLAAVATITRFPELPDENPEGVLEAVLGVPGDPNVEVAKVLVREAIEEAHPAEAIAEAEGYGDEVPHEALVGREDLTHLPLPTIDPEDARDHDDAVWAVRNADGSYRAWIAIADVSHYVRPGTALDESAMMRGNSIYLPDRAIPMLPRALSSNLCSLLPNVTRLCLCVEVDLDPTGTVTAARIFEGFMRSRAGLTYSAVARALGLAKHAVADPDAEAMREDLAVLWELSRLLRARRMRRGALDFDLPEAKVVLDLETGAPLDVEKRAHDPGVKKAYELIEELMLLANETVARELVTRNVPGIFRVHAPPNPERLERFVTMCETLDVGFELEDASDPKKLSTFLKRIASHPQKQVLHSLLLRAMKQAVYDVNNNGHFGLASTAYLHFTSPIRRYPDLVVHRMMRALLQKERIDTSPEAEEKLRLAASTASDCERRGMDIEREVVDLYRALYMRSHIGEIYEGTVTAVVGTGLFVAIDNPFVDVLVRLDALGPDGYEVDETGLYVTGTRSGEQIKLGDTMLVQIEDVAVLRRSIYGRRVIAVDEEGATEPRIRKVRRTASTNGPDKRVRAKVTKAEAKGRVTRGGTNGSKKTKTKKGSKAKKTRH
ncbi:ribonuclease R [Polyangium sp. y55x31]|uniref:ribonuclease R n=1 Tax=Polyangium sp. y55x31 TaxID=3042688 RepID=UPI002482DB90|nr:ribonuclease R [Polyangium sp. y55x31]MDI1483964.1 ribonuclease R [Polyangium sp. y55x31]